jgi:hypothetical protein
VTHSSAAAGALRNLAVNPKLRDQIADEGAITPLVDLLKLPNLRVVKHAGTHFTFLNTQFTCFTSTTVQGVDVVKVGKLVEVGKACRRAPAHLALTFTCAY